MAWALAYFSRQNARGPASTLSIFCDSMNKYKHFSAGKPLCTGCKSRLQHATVRLPQPFCNGGKEPGKLLCAIPQSKLESHTAQDPLVPQCPSGAQVTVYDDEHMGDFLGMVVHFTNEKTAHTPGGVRCLLLPDLPCQSNQIKRHILLCGVLIYVFRSGQVAMVPVHRLYMKGVLSCITSTPGHT